MMIRNLERKVQEIRLLITLRTTLMSLITISVCYVTMRQILEKIFTGIIIMQLNMCASVD